VGSRGDDAVRLVATKNDVGSKICGPEGIGIAVGVAVVAAVAVVVNEGVNVITEYTCRRDMQPLWGDDGIELDEERNRRRGMKTREYTGGDVFLHPLGVISPYLRQAQLARDVRLAIVRTKPRKNPRTQRRRLGVM
jgi:hypothetical protein